MRKILRSACTASLALALLAAPARGDEIDDLAKKFGARESVRGIGISPEGKSLVVIAPRADGGEMALVLSLADGTLKPVLMAQGADEGISNCQFVLETKLVCTAYKREGSGANVSAASRLLVVSIDGSAPQQLTAKTNDSAFVDVNFGGEVLDYNVPGRPGSVLVSRFFPPEQRTGTMLSNRNWGLGVEAVDVMTLARRQVEPPRETAVGYYTDGIGNVRLMGTQPRRESGYAKREVHYLARANGDAWSELSTVTIDGGISSGFDPVAVDPTTNRVLGFDSYKGHTGLYSMALDGSGAKTLLLGRDDATIDHLIQIGRNRRIVGASFAIERREAEFFDPELKRLSASLARALGGGRSVSFVDATQDEGKLVIYAGSDTDPGRYLLFDKATRQLGELLDARPELKGLTLGQMKPVQFPATDGTMIPGYLTLPAGSDGKGLPAIVMPHGGPSSRDEWGFDWLAQYYVARGYAVLQPNYRGSAGLGSEWFQKNGFQSWQVAIGDVNDAGRWLLSQGIAAPGKLAIVGWSYGGYAALQSQVLDPDLYQAVVAVAPVTDLEQLRAQHQDQSNFLIVDNFIGRGPHVEAGSPARHADRFKVPTLLFHGDADTNVEVAASRLMRQRLQDAGKSVTYVEFDGLDHYLDDGAARARLLSQSDRFLIEALGL